MRLIFALIVFCYSLFASVVDQDFITVDNNSLTINNEASFYDYINKLGDDNLTKSYRKAVEPIDRLNNKYLAKANISTYEEAFSSLRYFFKAIEDGNSSKYMGTRINNLIANQQLIINELLAANRNKLTDENIVILIVNYCEMSKELNILNLHKTQMRHVAYEIAKNVLQGKYVFAHTEADLNELISLLREDAQKAPNEILRATLQNKLLVAEYQSSFIKTIDALHVVRDKKAWKKSNCVSLPDFNASVAIIDINAHSPLYQDYNKSLIDAQQASDDAKIDKEIIKIIFKHFNDSYIVAQIDNFLEWANVVWDEAQDFTLFVFENNSVQGADIVGFIKLAVELLILQWIVVWILEHRQKISSGHLYIFITKFVVVSYLIYYFATHVLGLNPTNLTIFASAFSLAIGFGMQSLIQNFLAGIIMIGDKTVKVGDVISLQGGPSGVVVSITYRTTTIKTADNTLVMLPNSQILLQAVENKTKFDPRVRLKATFLVDKGANLVEIEQILIKGCQNIDGVVKDVAPKLVIASMIPEGIVVDLRLFVEDVKYADTPAITRALYDVLRQQLGQTAQ